MPVIKLKDLIILSGLFENTSSICVLEDLVILVGPFISCVKLYKPNISFNRFLQFLSVQNLPLQSLLYQGYFVLLKISLEEV